MSLGDLVFEWLLLFKCQGSNRDLNNTCAAHGDVWGTNILTVRDKEASESSSNWAMMKTFSACIAGLWSCWSQWAVVQMYVSLHICNLLNHFLPEMCHLLSNIYFIFLSFKLHIFVVWELICHGHVLRSWCCFLTFSEVFQWTLLPHWTSTSWLLRLKHSYYWWCW